MNEKWVFKSSHEAGVQKKKKGTPENNKPSTALQHKKADPKPQKADAIDAGNKMEDAKEINPTIKPLNTADAATEKQEIKTPKEALDANSESEEVKQKIEQKAEQETEQAESEGEDIDAVALKAKLKRRNSLINVLIGFALLMIAAGLAFTAYYMLNINAARQSINGLRDVRINLTTAQTGQEAQTPWQQALMEANAETQTQNADFAAWLTIANTNIDYPVMFTPTDMEYYLRRSFDKQDSIAGTLFLNAACNLAQNTDNVIVYGHNLQSGDMFSELLNYKKQAFWEEHKIITFSTPEAVYEYEVVAAFSTVLDDNNPNTFHYDRFINADSAKEFDSFMQQVEALAYYTTGAKVEYGDKLLTLSTCGTSYNSNGERMVVIAKKISEYPTV